MKLMIVSGRSGSGKTVALRVLEDLGYYCVDNIPVNLLPALTHTVINDYENVAVSLDVRNLPHNPEDAREIIDYLPSTVELSILYLDADDQELVRRYSETRRLHPLIRQNMALDQAISLEKKLLDPVASRANLYINTTSLTPHQLADLVRERVMGSKTGSLVIVFESFGFKYGVPTDADYVFDARFLPNPFWEQGLKPYNGLDQPVQDFLASQPIVTKFIWQINSFMMTWLPHLERNNRTYLTIAVGCTGGQHRSVYIAEALAKQFRKEERDVQIRHRELTK
ncbi:MULTISPECIES: RNase adapter RapZ [unclassified Thalassotalea]|uniref:RNase adapter RapZ n=1 Tax=unclassified Thalassotalea TaxID=2614972 RepID=UPI0010820D9D|nr:MULTISPECIES: RNase adapter RapZ [unclassified Thalassotalea]NMP15719.1 RNase adapter RapZ [Thalassotalea sp. Y01]QBY04774.1 RNase adapter RapZ [Thalassotalea sp. HSM 43]